VPSPDDQRPARRADGAAASDLAAMVRVLEQRCREAEGQARLADEGRRLKRAIHQQQVQTDLAAQHRREAEAAYGQVRGALARVAAELQQAGGPGAEALAIDLLAIVGGEAETAARWPPPPVPPQAAADLSSRLVRLVRTAGLVRTARRWEWLVRGLCVVASVLALSLVFGRLGASSVEVAGVQVAAPAPLVSTPMMPTPGTGEANAAWARLAPQLDSTWERDWPGTIALLDGFLEQWPTYAVAQDKLYAALLADAEANLQAQQMGAGVAELERAARLLPERGEAWARLAQLATVGQSDRI
jgi:hypothetical protein